MDPSASLLEASKQAARILAKCGDFAEGTVDECIFAEVYDRLVEAIAEAELAQ